MILQTRTRVRRGITLLEVLTAIFIMGIGLLALLTLFPLGALSMARAVRDDRAAAIAPNAASMATAFDLRNDVTLDVNGNVLPTSIAPSLASAPAGSLAPDPNEAGYPVLVDPLYVNLGAGPLGAVPGLTPGVRRCSPSYVASLPSVAQPQAIARWFTFQDEIVFQKTGEPTGSGVSVNRPGSYSWAYLLRRSRSSSPALTELSVLVYYTRPTDAPGGEVVCYSAAAALGTAGTTTLTVPYTGDKPNIRKGGWVMDTSYRTVGTGATVNGYCYQVAAVTDTGAGSMTLELETPLRENVSALVLLENVITVLDRGTTWRP